MKRNLTKYKIYGEKRDERLSFHKLNEALPL